MTAITIKNKIEINNCTELTDREIFDLLHKIFLKYKSDPSIPLPANDKGIGYTVSVFSNIRMKSYSFDYYRCPDKSRIFVRDDLL